MRHAAMGDYESRDGSLIHRLSNIAGEVEIGAGSRIDAFVTITGRVKLGRCVHISTQACIFGKAGVEIGDYSGISVGVKLFSETEDLSGDWMLHPTVGPNYRRSIGKRVRIGKHCSVGAGSVLLPGAYLPDGACVGALSLVKTRLLPWSIYAGIPVRLVRLRSRRALELQSHLESQ